MAKHHYVPKYLLNRHKCKNKKGHIYQCAKADGSIKLAKIKNEAACEEGYNTYSLSGVLSKSEDFEWTLDDVDNEMSRHVDKICSTDGIQFEEKDRNYFCYGVAVQIARCKRYRQMINDSLDSIIAENPLANDNQKEIVRCFIKSNRDDYVRYIASPLVDPDSEMSKSIRKLIMVLFVSDRRDFIISDNPVVRSNFLVQGENGIRVKGAVLYFPISPRYTVALFCNSVKDTALNDISRGVPNNRADLQIFIRFAQLKEGAVIDVDDLLHPNRFGACTRQLNQLQAENATDYTYASKKALLAEIRSALRLP